MENKSNDDLLSEEDLKEFAEFKEEVNRMEKECNPDRADYFEKERLALKIQQVFDETLKGKRRKIKDEEKLSKALSVISIIGITNIIIIKYSVEWWSTLHQPASIKLIGTSTIHPSMLLPLFLMLLVLLVYCALIFLMKYKTEIIKIKKQNIKRL